MMIRKASLVPRRAAAVDDWVGLTESARRKQMDKWNPYEGDGRKIVRQVCALFRKAYSSRPGVLKVRKGIYHGGTWSLAVLLRRGSHPRLPREFYGLPVIRLTEDSEAS